MQSNKEFNEVIEIAKYKIREYISNKEDIEDLAQNVAMKYYLNIDDIEKETKSAWISATARNLSIDFKRRRKNRFNDKMANFDDYEATITDTVLDKDNDNNPEDILKNIESTISKPDRELLREYARLSNQTKKLAKRKRLKYEALKKRIYRLKKDMRAKYNRLYGIKASKDLFGAKLNENLLNFIKKLKKAVETNNFESMKIYFSDCKIPDEIDNIVIDKVYTYNVIITEDKSFDIYVIQYLNDTYKAIVFKVKIYNENSIKIVDFPTIPKYQLRFNKRDIPKEIYEKIVATKPDGTHYLSKQEMWNLLYDHGVTTVKYLEEKKD